MFRAVVSLFLPKHTSGLVNARAMATIPGHRSASVPIGPTSCCKFGVKRKGTDSVVIRSPFVPLKPKEVVEQVLAESEFEMSYHKEVQT